YGNTESGIVPPAVDNVVHRAADDPRAPRAELTVQIFLVYGRGLATRALTVRPRAAEDPVVEPLATVAKARTEPVVRAGDIAVQRHRDACGHFRHLVASL